MVSLQSSFCLLVYHLASMQREDEVGRSLFVLFIRQLVIVLAVSKKNTSAIKAIPLSVKPIKNTMFT